MILFLTAIAIGAQEKHPQSYWYEGVWQGYDGEWTHVTRQVLALAEATPEAKYNWRPTAGVRTFAQVYMHIAVANFELLNFAGPKLPEGWSSDM